MDQLWISCGSIVDRTWIPWIRRGSNKTTRLLQKTVVSGNVFLVFLWGIVCAQRRTRYTTDLFGVLSDTPPNSWDQIILIILEILESGASGASWLASPLPDSSPAGLRLSPPPHSPALRLLADTEALSAAPHEVRQNKKQNTDELRRKLGLVEFSYIGTSATSATGNDLEGARQTADDGGPKPDHADNLKRVTPR